MLIILTLIINSVLAYDISPETLGDLTDIINNREIKIPDDHELIEHEKIGYRLYTRRNRRRPALITDDNLHLVNKRFEIIIMIHGWLTNYTNEFGVKIKDAYLKRGHYNVFLIDWDTYSAASYGMAYLYVPEVGQAIAEFVSSLLQRGYSIKKFHVIGHSLGAHIAGFAGQEIQKRHNGLKLPRITGLDPAGPMFNLVPDHERLSRDDAEFVDVIHSNSVIAGLGIISPSGTADFYPQGGGIQLGCMGQHTHNFDLVIDHVVAVVQIYLCCHIRSLEFYSESILSNNFVATKCDSYFHYITVCNGETAIMGEGCEPGTSSGRYYLDTNKNPPYGRGE